MKGKYLVMALDMIDLLLMVVSTFGAFVTLLVLISVAAGKSHIDGLTVVQVAYLGIFYGLFEAATWLWPMEIKTDQGKRRYSPLRAMWLVAAAVSASRAYLFLLHRGNDSERTMAVLALIMSVAFGYHFLLTTVRAVVQCWNRHGWRARALFWHVRNMKVWRHFGRQKA